VTKPAEKKTASVHVLVAIVAVIVLLGAILAGWDIWIRKQREFTCGDGPRYAIDTRQFTTQYSAYSAQLEANIGGKGKVALKIDPVQVQKLSEAMQSASEFQKYLVAGFNSCAIEKVQYARLGTKFHALDQLARQIGDLASKSSPTTEEGASLSELVDQYSDLVHSLTTDK
jgi:hypothetical protein